MRFFQRVLILESLIVSLCLKYLVQSSKWTVQLGIWEVVFFPVLEEIVYSFLVYYFLDKRVWFSVISSSYLSVLDMDFFAIPSLILSHSELLRIVTKVDFKYFNESFSEASLFEKFIFELDASSYSFKTTFILSRQIIPLNKMVVLTANLTILISWFPFCIPLIRLSALNLLLASTSSAIMHKNIENRHPWQTSRVRMKGSDRRSFILILDWVLVCT